MDKASSEEYDEPGVSDAESQGDDVDTKQPMSPSSTKSPAHLQKRRRVTRACDECRRKKIKCDGKQPCTHCTVYSYGWSTQSPPPLRLRATHSSILQNAPTTNPPTAGGTPPRNTWRISSIASTEQRRFCTSSSRTSTSMTPESTWPSSKAISPVRQERATPHRRRSKINTLHHYHSRNPCPR